jgi:hypothetical protein
MSESVSSHAGMTPQGAGCHLRPGQPDRCDERSKMLTTLQQLPRDAEMLAFEAGCEDYGKREVHEVEGQGGRAYLHLGVRRAEPPRR